MNKASREIRPVYIALNPLSKCLSSAAIEVGNTRVICAVRHPQQLVHEYRGDRGRVSCEVHRIDNAGRKDDEAFELDLSLALECVAEQLVMLEEMPQLLVEVSLEIIRDDGALWDALSTGLATALAAGGIPMNDIFSACTAGLLKDGSLVADVTKEQEDVALALVTVCASLHSHQIAYLRHQGSIEVSTLQQLTTTAMVGCEARAPHIMSQLKDQESLMKVA